MQPEITIAELRQHLSYDFYSGVLIWRWSDSKRLCWNRRLAGQQAGTTRKDGYRIIRLSGRSYYAHRIAFALHTGRWPTREVDHRDGNPSNNAWSNLREATHVQNIRNKKRRTDNRSGTTGVYWVKKTCKWAAQIWIEGKVKHLGAFDDKQAAIDAREDAVKKYFGEFVPR